MKACDLGLVVGLLGLGVVAQSPFGCGSGGAGPDKGLGGAGGDGWGPTTGSPASASVTGAGGSTADSSAVASGSTASSATSTTANSSSSTTAVSSSASTGTGGGGGIVIKPGNMIDDMEAGTGEILMQGGRIGAWYSYNDMTAGGVQTPLMGSPFIPEIIPGGNGASTRASHTYGLGFTTWGAGMGFDLNNNGTIKSTYSAAGFTGIAFWAKGSPGIRVKVLTSATVPAAEGGTCVTMCSDNHGMLINLTPNWAQYGAPFANLTQEGWGTAAPLDLTTVLAVQFQVAAGASFDFWIDDIGFY